MRSRDCSSWQWLSGLGEQQSGGVPTTPRAAAKAVRGLHTGFGGCCFLSDVLIVNPETSNYNS